MLAIYSSTKVFNDYLSRALSYEYADKIDCLSLKPGFVSTNMTNNKPVNNQTCSAEEFAKEGLRYLGNVHHTPGHWKHKLGVFQFSFLPEKTLVKILANRVNQITEN